MKAKPQLYGLPAYKPGKPISEVKKELGLDEVIKLASNENPYGSSKLAKQAVIDAVMDSAIYPDGYSSVLRNKVAQHLGVQEEQLIFGNGTDEVIQFLCRAFLTPSDNTVTADPTFSQYKLNAAIEGAEIREVPLTDMGEHNLDEMLQKIDENTKIVWVCNPNNPSGNYIGKDVFEAFLKQVPEHVIVASDEAYIEYTVAEDYPDTIPLLDQYKNLVVLRTFSKAYGLASLRIGYGVASPEIIQVMEPLRPAFNTTAYAHTAAVAALDDQTFVQESAKKNRIELEKYEAFCKKHQLFFYPSQTNFILIDVGIPGDEIFSYLLSKGYITRSGQALGFPTCIRISIGTEKENEGVMLALSELLKERSALTES
ncbi:histidinol-phosphate transaminase [Alkalicoccobacillus murimartini]|uniref:Histidinol-phosphate aminotransferase n=1 Tax=Alkalicoccobacillus murimartini TaxID=171685 RepID=A0ABT9YDJ9_9BACI|nr:histidinol-phosphate transaminase [Alkalicoccobacillus murimartini]MDQ0205928.1 histidinol-phosphate aminotransferase [Alkalicoccobacillus murimartini]